VLKWEVKEAAFRAVSATNISAPQWRLFRDFSLQVFELPTYCSS